MLRRANRWLCDKPATGMAFFAKAAKPEVAASEPTTQAMRPLREAVEVEREATTGAPPPVSRASAFDAAVAHREIPRHVPTVWMSHASWASLGDEFKGVDQDKFVQPAPVGFLSDRAVTDIQPAEELLSKHLEAIRESYDGVDVRDPSTMKEYALEGTKTTLSMGDKVRTVAEFVSGHVAHQVSLPEWKELFDLTQLEMDVMYWLWVLHLHLIARRANSVNIAVWSRRREVMQELLQTMFQSWITTSEEVMGRPPLSKIRSYIRDMYYVTATNLDEALRHDGPGGDLMLMGVLLKFCPLPRPEDVPMFTYYTLVHYIRFHTALFDRIDDEEFCKGNFHFAKPNDPSVFAEYSEVDLDAVIRTWQAPQGDRDAAREAAEREKAAAEAKAAGGKPEDA